MHIAAETSPRSKNPFESELQNNIKEYESYKTIREKFKELILDIPFEDNVKTLLGLCKNSGNHAYGKGRFFTLATSAHHVKSETRCEKWFGKHLGEIYQGGCKEFSKDRRIMKLALRIILNSRLSKLEDNSPRNESLSKKIEDMLMRLNPNIESSIDFPAILKLLQNDDSLDSANTSPRSPKSGNSSSKVLKRQFSRAANSIQDRLAPPSQRIRQDKVIERGRAYSSPTHSRVKKLKPVKTNEMANRQQNMDVFMEMLDQKGCTIILEDGIYRSVKGTLTAETVKMILNEFEIIIPTLEVANTRSKVRDSLMSLYDYANALKIFSDHLDLYKLFLKLVISIYFCPWGLDKNKFELLIHKFHQWLENYNIPRSRSIKYETEDIYIWKLIDSAEVNLAMTDIAILSDPYQGFQEALADKSNLPLSIDEKQAEEYRKFPPYKFLQKVFDHRIYRLQCYHLKLAAALKSGIDYLESLDSMQPFFANVEDTKGISNKEKLQEWLGMPLIHFEAMLNCFDI